MRPYQIAFVVILSAMMGFVAGRLSATWKQSNIQASVQAELGQSTSLASAPSPHLQAEETQAQVVAAADAEPESKTELAPTPSAKAPQKGIATYKFKKLEVSDEKLNQWLRHRAERGELIERSESKKTGGYFTKERFSNGLEARREYGANGVLMSEDVVDSDGTKISRSFFTNGQPKFAQFILKDGSKDLIMADSNGFFLNRTVEYPNGNKLVFEYDETGNIVRRIILEKDKPGRVIE